MIIKSQQAIAFLVAMIMAYGNDSGESIPHLLGLAILGLASLGLLGYSIYYVFLR